MGIASVLRLKLRDSVTACAEKGGQNVRASYKLSIISYLNPLTTDQEDGNGEAFGMGNVRSGRPGPNLGGISGCVRSGTHEHDVPLLLDACETFHLRMSFSSHAETALARALPEFLQWTTSTCVPESLAVPSLIDRTPSISPPYSRASGEVY